MAHGLSPLIKREIECKPSTVPSSGSTGSNSPAAAKSVTLNGSTKMGSRRIFTPQFKLQVLDSYRKDHDCKGNQRATARKYGIHRRQIQKWLQCESNLRSSVMQGGAGGARGASATAVIRDYAEASVVPSLDIGRHSVVTLGFSNSTTAPYTANPDTHHDSSSSSVSNSPVPNIAPVTPPVMYPQHPMPYTMPQTNNFSSYHHEIRHEGPIDLSLAHRVRNEPSDARVPAVKCEWRQEEITPMTPSSVSSPPPVDLSCRNKRKLSTSCSSVASSSSSTSSSPSPNAVTPPKVVKLFKPYLDSDGEDEASSAYDDVGDFKKSPTATNDPIIWSNHPCSSPLLYENNNVYAYDYNFYPSPPYHNMAAACAAPPTYGDYIFSSWSPVDGAYSSGSESGEWPAHHMNAQPYSVDFKLKAIETYYHDVSCRADQCAVPPKFGVPQRQVDKWLQQEDDLRQ